ncbi:MAG: AsmA-like C-terminal region-containing protein [Bacteroidota bacterium]|nr:AsmA-like C-terminal region-containing protein [Bacteroidota bacterium]
MKKFFKISGISLLVIFLILLALPFLFKGKIIQAIKDETNKSLNAEFNFDENEIGLSLIKSFPDLLLTMERVSIVGKDSFAGDTLVYLPKLAVEIDIMTAIKGEQIKIHQIRLDQPFIQLKVLKSGKANWDIALPDTTTTDSASFFDIALKKLQINNGKLIYDDASLGFFTSLNQFNHTLKGDFNQDNFLLETLTDAEQFTLAYGGINYIHKVKANIKANLDMDMQNMKFTFSENDIFLNDLNLGGEGFVDLNDEDMDFDIVFNTKKTDFKTILSLVPGVFTKDFAKAKASGKLALNGYFKGKMTDDKMPGYGLTLDIDNGQFQYPDLPKSLNDVYVDFVFDNPSGIFDNAIVDLKRLDLKMAGEAFHAELLAKTFESNPYIKGLFNGTINLNEFRAMIPLEKSTELSGVIKSDVKFDGYVKAIEVQDFNKFYATGNIFAQNFKYKNPESLKQGIALNSHIAFTPQKVDVKQLEGKIGMSDFAAVGYLNNLFAYMMKDQLLKGQFTFKSNYINANEFLTDEEVVATPSAADTMSLEAFDVPGNLDFELQSQINTLIYDNLTLTNLKGGVLIKEKQMYLEKLAVNVLGGSITLDGVYDSHNPKFPFSDMAMDIKSLDIIQTYNYFDMVKQLAPIAKYTEGLFNANVVLHNNYNQDLSVDYPSVTGVIQMGISEGAIKNMPIISQLAEKLKIDKFKNMTFKNLNFKLNILNGKVMLDSLKLPLWTGANAKISGYSALDQSIAYVAKLSIPRKDFGEVNTALNTLTSQAKSKGVNVDLSEMVDVDVIVGGFFAKPDVKISLHDAKKNLVDGVKNQLQDEAEKRKKAAEDEAKRKAEIQKQKAIDSLNRLKQQGIDKINAEKQALEQKALEQKRLAEEKAKAEAEKAKAEAAKKIEEEKQKTKDKLKKGLDGIIK